MKAQVTCRAGKCICAGWATKTCPSSSLRWMEPGSEASRQVGLGTFDRTIFERLDSLADLGINAIELLPVMDSQDTLN
jgi:glycosidase